MKRLFEVGVLLIVSLSLLVGNYDALAAKNHKVSRKGKRQVGAGDVWERVRQGLKISTLGSTYEGIEAMGTVSHTASPRKPLTSSATEVAELSIPNNATGEKPRLLTVISPKKLIVGESQLLAKLRSKQTISPYNSKLFKKDLEPSEKYTVLGRLRLAPKNTLAPLGREANDQSSTDNVSEKQDKPLKSPLVQRIRTRLGFHPELAKPNLSAVITTTKSGAVGKRNEANDNAVIQQFNGTRCADLNNKELVNLAQQGMLPQNFMLAAEQCKLKKSAIFERVNRQVSGFSQRISFVSQSTERARPYLYHIVDELSKHGLPLDLALLPIVESGYQPTALSSASAAGVWQFIPSTGRDFDLEQNLYYDARLDITAATHAAIRFLSGLRDRYHGDWLLALAAYNCGPGNVDAAIAKNLADGLDTDYWSLTLPAETQDYVPRLLALSTIFSNPGRYGLKLRPVKNEPYFIKVHIDHEFDINHLVDKKLSTIAKLANFSGDEFGFLNPAFLKSEVTGRKPFNLLMPISNANQLHESLAFMARTGETYNESKSSDDYLFSHLSKDSVPELFSFNFQQPLLAITVDEMPKHQLSQSGIKLTPDTITTNASSKRQGYLAVHYLDKGESLKSIVESYGVSEMSLREINKLKRRQKLGLGHRILIPIEQFAASPKQNRSSVLYRHKNAIDS